MLVQLAEYAPDRSRLDMTASDLIRNVVPTINGYGPLPNIAPFTDALAAAPLGAFMARQTDGSIVIFAGTATKLYKLASDGSWTDVTRASGGDYSATAWRFDQFGDTVIAVNGADANQAFTLASSTDFDALSSSSPIAGHVWVESGYLGLGNISGQEKRFYRSGLDSATSWTIGHSGCTYQDIPDGGAVQGACGDETGAFIFTERKVVRTTNQPGLSIGFTMADYDPARGTPAPGSIVRAAGTIFFLSEEGFYSLGQPSVPIGAERVNKTFIEDVDNIETVQGAADPRRQIVWWRYTSQDGGSKMLGYNWFLDRWTSASLNIKLLLSAGTAGYTLGELESVLGYTALSDVPFPLGSQAWKGGRPALAGFDANNKLGFFDGDALEATMDSSGMPLGGEGLRSFVSGFRPVGDVSGAYGQVGHSETFGGALAFTAEAAQNVTGLIPTRSSGRKQRLRVRVPAATEWTDISGFEVQVRKAGRR